ncbi:hypothetical protein VMCG_10610 [Cytospora schulzeri]|uniref:Uncharacterized protein n=1 Tax=Cytospora schulzeri TaxID=448051 RepID=A0A423V9P9_9PEZI|nr:hypothetical protein VMCG_10610 [Valsa malicola]
MKSPIYEAQKSWEKSCRRGQMDWLENTTFISADVFQPLATAPPKPWKRIAVPPATVRHGDQKIYKRVVANLYADTKYIAVAAELDSQGFGGRKRAKTNTYLEAWSWGGPRFDPACEDESTGGYDLVRARLQVKRAYKNIKEDNQDIVAKLLPVKRSTFPPAQLTWVPRKRHNTRWPVTPPEADAPLLAELQPLIKFELHPGQIDDPAFWEQQDAPNLPEPGSAPIQLDAQQAQKLSSRRLSIAKRPSLSTISEELKEPSNFLTVTPSRSRRSFYGSPLKRWSVVTDSYNTPTKVASSPLKNFTITATPDKMTFDDPNDVDETNKTEVAQFTPLKAATEDSITPSAIGDDTHHDIFSCPSTPLPSSSPTPAASKKTSIPAETTNRQGFDQCPSTPLSSRAATPAAPVAVFDQPTPEAPTEPEHETRRRVSLDNARRSDRQSDGKVQKWVRSWVSNTFAINRRHSISTTIQEKPRQNRRHTLDVDVGRTPDIFGQAIQGTNEEVSNTKQETTAKETNQKDTATIAQENVHREMAQEEPSHEVIMSRTEDSSAASREETVQAASPSSAVRTHIDWDQIEPISERYDHCRTIKSNLVSNISSPTVESPTIDIPTADSAETTEPTVEIATSHTPIVDASVVEAPIVEAPVVEDPAVESLTVEATTVDDPMSDEPTVDAHDDSELSLLRNFVRRAQMKPKRRSSATLFTGSPMAKTNIESAPVESPRVPLGEKDPNRSPSPSKKRKEKDAEDVSLPATTKTSRLVKPDLEDTMPQPQRKKRKKGVEMDCPDDILNPDIEFSQKLTQKGASGGLRRSKRVATSKPTESVTPSQIPVRLPGSSGMMTDADMPAVSTAGLMQRKTEKDLATLTRTNTRRNKGGAVPVPARLADMLDVAEATASDPFCSPAKPITTIRGAKAVRWDEILFRTQGENYEVVAAVLEEEKDKEQDETEDDAEEELQPPRMRTELGRPSNPVGEQLAKHEDKIVAAPAASPAPPQSEPEKKKKALRPRASRLPAARRSSGLPAATPKRKAAAATASSLPAPPLISKAAARSTAGATPTAKRTGVLGVSLGTPAPKRRGGNKK